MLIKAVKRILSCLAIAVLSQNAAALTEEQIKAAYIVNFSKFTQWPSPERGQFDICFIGKDSLLKDLKTIEKQKIHKKGVHVVIIDGAEDISHCSVIYLSNVGEGEEIATIQKARSQAILTVSSNSGFIRRGGMIEMMVIDDSVKFSINYASAIESHLKISSKMLELALEVITDDDQD